MSQNFLYFGFFFLFIEIITVVIVKKAISSSISYNELPNFDKTTNIQLEIGFFLKSQLFQQVSCENVGC